MMESKQLIDLAIKAMRLSYSPYSHFAVGAAILCKDGNVYEGANIENSSYGLTMCAERNAIYNALMDGKTKEDFAALAIVADAPRAVSPCGACRQVISELCPSDMPIYLSNLEEDVIETNPAKLLPYAFVKEDLK